MFLPVNGKHLKNQTFFVTGGNFRPQALFFGRGRCFLATYRLCANRLAPLCAPSDSRANQQ
jgi:hypothetical protein